MQAPSAEAAASKEPCADQFPNRSRQRRGRSFRRLVQRDRLFERRYALLLRVVFRREGGEHGFDVGLPTAEGGSGEDVRRGWVSRPAIEKAPAWPPPIAGVEPPDIVPRDTGAVPSGKPVVGVAGR